MARKIVQPYHCEPMGELARQLLYSPPGKRIGQVLRAERLHDELEDEANYPFDFISYRISQYRSETDESTLLVGQAARADLRLMIDQLSRSVGMPEVEGQLVETADTIAKRLHVSTKTIARWRRTGLRWRWMEPREGSRQKWLGIERSALELFLQQNQGKVEKASQFTQLGNLQRKQLLDEARKMARDGRLSLNQVAARLARQSGRALETIRQLLEHHDRDHGDEAIFKQHTGPLTSKQKRFIRRAFSMGIAAPRIAEHFRRTPTTVYRVIHQHRAKIIRGMDMNYRYSPLFDREDVDPGAPGFMRTLEAIRKIRGDLYSRDTQPVALGDLPEQLRGVYGQARLDKDVQQTLLVRYHYLHYRADQLRKQLNRYTPRAGDLDRIEEYIHEAGEIRDMLFNGNLWAVLTTVRKHMIAQEDKSTARLIELLEVGNMVLIESIDQFDFSRQQSFESFLTWAMMRRFASLEKVASEGESRIRAKAKLDGKASLKRMVDAAGESGVGMTLEDE